MTIGLNSPFFLALYLGLSALVHFGLSFRYVNILLGILAGITTILLLIGR